MSLADEPTEDYIEQSLKDWTDLSNEYAVSWKK